MKKFDIRLFAKACHRRREELRAERPYHVVPIDDLLCRILERDEDYIPVRRRTAKKRPLTKDPRISSLVRIANALDTTPDDLLGFKAFVLTRMQRRQARTFVAFLIEALGLNSPDLDDEEKPPSEIAGGE